MPPSEPEMSRETPESEDATRGDCGGGSPCTTGIPGVRLTLFRTSDAALNRGLLNARGYVAIELSGANAAPSTTPPS